MKSSHHGKDYSDGETDDEDYRNRLLLLENASSSTLKNLTVYQPPQQHIVNVPSHGSFYTEFYPPDLNQFKTERIRYENARPGCMTSAWRVISFFIVVFVLPTILISVPLYARYHLYHARTLAFTDGDMRSFHNDVSSFWCQGQRLMSNGSFEAYLTKETKRVREKRISKLSAELLLTHDDVEEWGVYLIRGSHFTLSTCSRWPGGTLLVVQGESNMRRCFYKEEKFQEEMRDTKTQNTKKPSPNIIHKAKIDEELVGGGEDFEGEDDIPPHEVIRQLYSSKRNDSERPFILEPTPQDAPKNESFLDVPTTLNDTMEGTSSKDELLKTNKKNKSIPKRKKKGNKEKNLKEPKEDSNGTRSTTTEPTPGRLVKRNVASQVPTNPGSNLESVLVDRGSYFFNINDTQDVTTGNSSFSSSEEFLKQCSSDSVFAIDLSPFPDCSHRSNLNDSSITWKFRANETDNYYFIFTSDNSIEVNIISFRLLLERRLYDVSDYIEKCSNGSQCAFPFSFMKSEGVIVDFNERYKNISKMDDLNNYEITTICQPRSVVYTVFILLVPFIIIMFAFR